MTQTSHFSVPERSAQSSPERTGTDVEHFSAIAAALRADIAAVEENLASALAEQTGDAQGRVQRDASVHHFRNRLTGLRSFQLDAILGRMTPADGGAHVYVGRLDRKSAVEGRT